LKSISKYPNITSPNHEICQPFIKLVVSLKFASKANSTIFSPLKTPEIIWEACAEYFEATDSRKWNKTDFKGGTAKKVLIPTDTPYTMSGLTLFLGVNIRYFNDFKDSLRDKKDTLSLGFSEVITRVEQIIYTQKFEGAVVGAFSSNIIARDLGLVDKKEIKNDNLKPIEFTIIRKEKKE
jgi:hypothetical protein